MRFLWYPPVNRGFSFQLIGNQKERRQLIERKRTGKAKGMLEEETVYPPNKRL
jgi:hypothetical protein